MGMGPERSKPLHNFTMPCGLRWGNQKFLRCVKVNSNGETSNVDRRPYGSDSAERRKQVELVVERSGSNDRISEVLKFAVPPPGNGNSVRKFRNGNGKGDGDGDDGIAAVREKLMFDLQTAADKMKDAILREGLEDEEEERSPIPSLSPSPAIGTGPAMRPATTEAPAAESVRPWNLRTRRAACNAPNGLTVAGGGGGVKMPSSKIDVMKPNGSSPLRTDGNKSPRLRTGIAGGASVSGEKRDRAKFSISLTRREIEEDFMTMVAHRPPRRPKKRPKNVQKQLDTLFPGLWLTEITADMYKVNEAA